MSKKSRRHQDQRQQQPSLPPSRQQVPAQPESTIAQTETPADRPTHADRNGQEIQNGDPGNGKAVPKHRQCPICHKGLGGVGRVKTTWRVSGTKVRRYYKCDQCGHDWTVDVRTEVVAIESKSYEKVDDDGVCDDDDEG